MKCSAIRLALAATLLLATGRCLSAAEPAVVSFILDCSKRYGLPRHQGRPEGEDHRRHRARRPGSTPPATCSRGLSTSSPPTVIPRAWRCGFLATGWPGNPGKENPGLLEQNKYLEQTLGFEVLRDLLPGDDVELIRSLSIGAARWPPVTMHGWMLSSRGR